MARRRAGVADLCGPGFLSSADLSELKTKLTAEAKTLGFDCIGVTEPGSIETAGKHFLEFIASGGHGDMDWLAAQPERRVDPRGLWQDVRSVIMLGVNYGPDEDPLAILEQRTRAAISVYAQGDDYHDLIKKRLKALARWLVATAPSEVKVFVDTAAVMEKPLAQAAHLGWQGKHTNLVSREFGSWLFLGSIFTVLDLPADEVEKDHCGNCHACLDVLDLHKAHGTDRAVANELPGMARHRIRRIPVRNREEAAVLAGSLDEIGGFAEVVSDGLVAHHIESGVERGR